MKWRPKVGQQEVTRKTGNEKTAFKIKRKVEQGDSQTS